MNIKVANVAPAHAAASESIAYSIPISALGELPVARGATGVCSIQFAGDRSELADRLGEPGSARAVAGACAANRVVRSNGDLSGYRWGVERKRSLLEREVLA